MITEDYVSFETAKLLKEKGFDWPESPFYSEQDRDEWRQNNSYTVPNEEYNPELPFDSETLTLVAPHVSLQMAMKWLREKHHYNIEIDTIGLKYLNTLSWRSVIYNPEYDMECYYEDGFKTYEEACEAAIKYCLENLVCEKEIEL